MNTTRRKYSINDQDKKIVDLEIYRQPKVKIIDYQYYRTSQNQKTLRCKTINDGNNSFILMSAIHYIYRKILKNNTNALLLELDIDYPLKQFQSLPEQFRKWYNRTTIASVLKEVVTKISEHKGEVDIELQTNRYLNQYPFCKCVLIIWSRTRAAQFLQKHRKDYGILIGNQRQILLNYQSQLRFNTMQILIDSFNFKLKVHTHLFAQKYGTISKQNKCLDCYINQQNINQVYIEDTITKDCDTNNTQNSIQQHVTTPNSTKPVSKFNIDSSILSSLSPRSMNEGNYCPKCNHKIKFTRCTNCKQQSGEKRKSNRLAEYVSLFKLCESCGKKQIIYKGDLCRKCELSKI